MQTELTPASGRVRFGDFVVDVRSQELLCPGGRVRLQQKSFLVLTELLARPGQVVTREELVAALWPGDYFVDVEHGLNTAIRRLREALGDSAQQPRFVETLPKIGYRFLAEIEEIEEIEEIGADEGASPSRAVSPPAEGNEPAPPSPALPAAPGSSDTTLATESQSEPSPLPSAPTVVPARGTRPGIVAAAALTTVALIVAAAVVASRPTRRASADDASLSSPTTAAVDELIARSRYLRNHKRYADARRFVEEALKLDPKNAHALGGLSLSLFAEGRVDEARETARRALELDPNAFEAHRTLASIAQDVGDLAGAERHLRRAVEAGPEDSKSRNRLARLLLESGRTDEARQHILENRRLAPDDPDVQDIWVAYALHTGDYEEAIRRGEIWLAIWEGRFDGSTRRVRDKLGLAYVGARRHEEALAQFRAIDPEDRLRVALALGHSGRVDEARTILEDDEKRHTASALPTDPERADRMAMAWVAVGDFDRAFGYLEQQVAARWYPGWLDSRLFHGIRRDPRWPAFAQRLGREFFDGAGSTQVVPPLSDIDSY